MKSMEIKPQELRIGNLLSLSGERNLRVTLIEKESFRAEDEKGQSFKNTWADIRPVFLTDEILIKYNITENNYFYKENGVYWFSGHNPHVPIQYVHQLQNLYFALRQTELPC